ncbi:MAG: hypothetical protein IJP71_02095 [Lachnospiraceae bacterium]|nr:hypothetical protein [Lachnospiraceae bacterium]
MKNKVNNIIVLMSIFAVFAINVSYAEKIVDKKGRVIEEIKKPTAESTIDPDTITAADRRIVDLSLDYSGDTSKQYEGPSKNIFSNGYMYAGIDWSLIDQKDYTLIRHTSSITDLTGEKYFLNQDDLKDRIRLLIVTSDGMIDGKNGFFKIDGKTYYFDEDGLMVLGPCFDTIGNYFFFSYDTGELIEEIQKK